MLFVGSKTYAQEAYAVLSDGGKTVTFYYDGNKSSREGIKINNINDYAPYLYATTAVFDISFADYRPISTAYWFYCCSHLTTINGIENLNTAKVTSMSDMFYGCSSLTSLDVSNFNTEKVTSMSEMFCFCSSLTSLDVSNFNTENVTSIGSMFCACSSLTSLDVSKFNTENVTYMTGMFSGCSALTSLDLSNFNTKNVTNMSGMFSSCYVLKTIFADEEKWSITNVTRSGDMFSGCTALVGGNGTVYDANHSDHEYARIDKEGLPGYFTQVGTTGIEQSKAQPVTEGDAWYTLDGRRMTGQPAVGGVYVKDGRKVVVK